MSLSADRALDDSSERPDGEDAAMDRQPERRWDASVSNPYAVGFLVWLMRNRIDSSLVTEELLERFEAVYVGWYPTRQDMMRAELEALDREGDGADQDGDIDSHQAWQRCLDRYDLEERLDGIYVYRRDAAQ